MSDHAAIIVRKGNDILFVKRSMKKRNLPGAWAFPSGTKPEHETLFETAQREAMEELGVEVRPDSILCTQELPEFNDTLHFVLCSIVSGEPRINEPNEIDELLWMPFNSFLKKYDDSQIGHGLAYLRTQPDHCAKLA
jgi:8-oxo-dGTP pyrophosphatase MutT (NUDIX family)